MEGDLNLKKKCKVVKKNVIMQKTTSNVGFFIVAEKIELSNRFIEDLAAIARLVKG